MKKLLTLAVCALLFVRTIAQNQTPDAQGFAQAAALKKLSKKAKFGASLITQSITFSTAKGVQGTPVVTALEKGEVDLASITNKVDMGHLIYYNQFVRVKDYDFQIWYGNNFRNQRYQPVKMSLSGDDIYLDDNYGEFYGFEADGSGQRCRFHYALEYSDVKYLTRFFFHSGYPVKEHSISFTVPSWLKLDIQEENFAGYKIKKDVRREKDQITYTYTATDLPGIKEEPSSLARPYFLPHLVVTARTYTVNQKTYNGFKTLADLYAWDDYLYKKCDNNTSTLTPLVHKLTAGLTSDQDKVKALYYWVQDNIRYVAFEEGYAGFVPMTAQDVYKNKYGDCKGMANLLTQMLKIAGYDAHFAWIGTRDIPYDFGTVQSLCVANHAICVLYMGGQTYFLDGTQKYAPLGVNAYRIQGKSVLVENGDNFKLDTVPSATAESNIVLTKADLHLVGDSIVGHVTMTFNGESKNIFHNIYHGIPSDEKQDFVKSLVELGDPNAEATGIKTSDFQNRDIPIVIQGDVVLANQVTNVDKTCYMGIDFFPGSIARFIPGEERQTPIDIDGTLLSKDEISLELPSGAKPRYLPPVFTAAFQGDSIHADYLMKGHTVLLSKQLQIASPVINVSDFTAWKQFLDDIRKFDRNNISVNL
ncbi:transglutaminase-like domain-containing protein [Dinghuibacter silviterrae]|nr:transglutaminase-like domain-containing protein [Dinghuibacter silviterrae]